MAVTSDFGISATVRNTKASDLSAAADDLIKRYGVHLESGTGAGKADRVFADTRTLAASATENLDLAGSLTDAYGTTTSFARVKFILFHAAVGNTNNVVVGAHGSADFVGLLNAAGTLTLRPDATVAAMSGSADATGMVVTATTADIIKVTNSAGSTSVTYDVIIVGNSA